ncbi:hypothetical protein [Lentisalinibacter salinarum]|uniref:hypothetical protein n=1 Tax=Lentisalinibacter salinarum TaxID=2992239 RepID=UPI0038685B01
MSIAEHLEEARPVYPEIEAYISDVVEGLQSAPGTPAGVVSDGEALANEVFSVLTSRRFCYLSRKRVECYRQQVVTSLVRRIALGEPFRFFYDIGPGYHATTRPGELPLRFDVGLSELLILAQVHDLCHRIGELYPPGGKFWFVVDNLCALRTNDVPLTNTELYVTRMRELIKTTKMTDMVELIVESEAFDLEEYDSLLAGIASRAPMSHPSPGAVDNVSRFLGRPCTDEEAASRIELYSRTSAVTDQLVDRLIRDVHMTQRATGATLGFRPFAGGDQRTQAGELVLTRSAKGRLKPLLLTSRNVDSYDCVRFGLTNVLPSPIPYVSYAEPLSVEEIGS